MKNLISNSSNVVKEVGFSSRTKKILIKEAIDRCDGKDKFNRYKLCEEITNLMDSRYKGEGMLEYHTKRMGMDTTSKILAQIDLYFYRDYKHKS